MTATNRIILWAAYLVLVVLITYWIMSTVKGSVNYYDPDKHVRDIAIAINVAGGLIEKNGDSVVLYYNWPEEIVKDKIEVGGGKVSIGIKEYPYLEGDFDIATEYIEEAQIRIKLQKKK